MMKKTRLFPKIAAMMIVAIMVCVMVASASQGYASTPYGNDHNYYAYGTYYVDSATRVRAGTWVRTTDYATVPARTIGCQATLVYVNTGEVFYRTAQVMNPDADYFYSIITPSRPASQTACSVGWASVEGSPYIRLSPCYEGDNYSRSGNVESQLTALAEKTLTADNAYPVNAAGETYGSILLADMVGENPDLISAVNQDNVSGYIRLEDITEPCQSSARSVDQSMDLYDADGNVIGTFECGEAEVLAIDAPDFETAQAKANEILCQ